MNSKLLFTVWFDSTNPLTDILIKNSEKLCNGLPTDDTRILYGFSAKLAEVKNNWLNSTSLMYFFHLFNKPL